MFHALARPADANDSNGVTPWVDPPRDRRERVCEDLERGASFDVDADVRDPGGRVGTLRFVDGRVDARDGVRDVALRDDVRDEASRAFLVRAVPLRRVVDGVDP